ncbi:MAG: helix-turn-helix transcriptional regulator [Bacteroidales bacterium]|nr:helix-turn-helix transcriptional regulator [Bacteroidales bacterium]
MEIEQTPFTNQIVENIRKALVKSGLNQAGLSVSSDIPEKALSKILNKTQRLTMDHLSKIARGLSLREIDLLTWPIKFYPQEDSTSSPTEVLLQMRLTKEKKDQVLKLVFGENNIEILNK